MKNTIHGAHTPSPSEKHDLSLGITRRNFLKSTAAGTALATVSAFSPGAIAAEASGSLRVGLIGCGGRGTGAAAQALAADKNVKLVAMADAFANRLEGSLATLKLQKNVAGAIDVPDENQFIGFDAYKEVIKRVDVVLLATPPHFRPIHIEAAVKAGRHVFAEKPVAVDAPGVRAVIAACEEARRRKLAVQSGLCLRYSPGYREMVKRIHEGAIGEVRSMQANDFRGPIWVKPRQPGWTDMEYNMRNWYYFTWLSGDFNVEQHIHMLDLCAWVMKNQYPTHAIGTGGRQVRTGPDYGNIYDHHSVIYEYPRNVKLFATCRQQPGCAGDISATVYGSRGIAHFSSRESYILTDKKESFEGENEKIYQLEHDALFASIRKSDPIDAGDFMSHSTLMAIMGRMATYTGQKVTWEEAMNSQESLAPESYSWDAKPPISEIAIPGTTHLV